MPGMNARTEVAQVVAGRLNKQQRNLLILIYVDELPADVAQELLGLNRAEALALYMDVVHELQYELHCRRVARAAAEKSSQAA